MTVQFRLGPTDHKVVEDFLARGSSATSAITLDAKASRYQEAAAAAAREAGASVFLETASERLASPGYAIEKYPLFVIEPYSIARLATDLSSRTALVERTIAAHSESVTHVTAPHFYANNERSAHLNIDLAEMTRQQSQLPVRVVLTISNKFARDHATSLASEYVQAGIHEVELRLSPFGGDDESVKKIRDGFAASRAFIEAGMAVTLGSSGNLGQAAVALGHATSYSVGVGMLERVDYAAVVNRQKTPPKEREDGDTGGGPTAGIYLPGISATLPRRFVELLYDHADLRLRLGCRIGKCATNVRGPLLDRRDHYLHARATEMSSILSQPAGWRPTKEMQRLSQVLGLRRKINDHYLKPGMANLNLRTIESLIGHIEERRAS